MSSFDNHFKRKSIRLKKWDYSTSAAYFVTICTSLREHFFGELLKNKQVEDGLWMPRSAGLTAFRYWEDIPAHYPFVQIDDFVIMPNHLHGIVFISHLNTPHEFTKTRINLSFEVVSQHEGDFNSNKFGRQKNNLQSAMAGFKSAVTKDSRLYQPDFKWQARYHERVIRTEEGLNRARLYIRENRKNWFFSNDYIKHGDLYL